MRLCNHARSNQWTNRGTKTVKAMQETKNFVCIGHIANPSIPSRIFEAVTEACKGEEDDYDGERWVQSSY
jgi:hypothetical protein